jgi:hypothetical protein
MKYASSAALLPGASRERLLNLLGELKSFDYDVQIAQPDAACLHFSVPDEGYTWIITGGLAALFTSYSDVAQWSPHFLEKPDTAAQFHQLPLPKSQERHPLSTTSEGGESNEREKREPWHRP